MKDKVLGKLLISLALAVMCIGVNVQIVQADMGPKPSMEFNFVYETDTPLTITGGEQLECADAACADGEALQEAGPQRFTCTEEACSSLAYGYADYHRLVIRFSDGVTRESNVFGKSHFDAVYRVTVGEDDLWVEETGGRANPMLLVIVGSLVGVLVGGALFVATLVILILLIIKAGREEATFAASRWLFIITWIVILPFYIAGAFFSLTLPITLLLESAAAFVYATVKKHSRVTLLTLVALANLITQPLLWGVVMTRTEAGHWLGYIILEGLIVVIEAALLYGLRRKAQTFRESVILSLILNVVSFVVGLILPA